MNKYERCVKYILEYINDKIEIDNNDLMLLSNPMSFIQKTGALNALYDVKKIIKEQLQEPVDYFAELEQALQDELSKYVSGVPYYILDEIKVNVLNKVKGIIKE